MLALSKADARTKREEPRFSPLRITPSRKELFAINSKLKIKTPEIQLLTEEQELLLYYFQCL